jgi:hypothetical protein
MRGIIGMRVDEAGQDDCAGAPHHAPGAMLAFDRCPRSDGYHCAVARHDRAVVDDAALGIHCHDAAANDQVIDLF